MDFAATMTLIFSIVYFILIVGTMLVVLTDNANPQKTTAWLIVLIFIPAIGIILYYVFGYNTRRHGGSQESYERFKTKLLSLFPENILLNLHHPGHENKVLPQYHRLVNLLEDCNDSQVYYGSDVEVITSGKRKFEALIEDLENAQDHIHMEYFYFRKDATGKKVREILMRKASEGVKVRFIYENIANIDIRPSYYYEMRKSGVKVLPFTKASLPWIRRHLNYRDHRKIVVIDGKIGYTGGMNIGDDYSIKWRDTHLRIRGEGVYGLQLSFLHAWYDSGGEIPEDILNYFSLYETYSENLMQVVPEAPDSRFAYLLYATTNLIQNAKKYVYIQTPYYLPPEPLLQALKTMALSGVDVRIMVSRKSDAFFMDPAIKSYYEESLRAGIRIYELLGNFNHAKTMVVDDYVSIIGSANMDFRSLELCFEINTFMYDESIARQNYAIFFEDMKQCEEILLDEWLKRPWWKKLIQSFMKLLSPLL